MNANRQKMNTKSNCNVRSCSKQSNNVIKPTLKSGKQATHTPSIRCHEEVISEMSATNGRPQNFSCDINQHCYSEHSRRSRSRGRENTNKTSKYDSRPNTPFNCESMNGLAKVKDSSHYTMKSKSVPVVQRVNLEDSVDYIPVKLTNKVNGFKKRAPKDDLKYLNGEKINKNRGPTWDELLKAECKSTLTNGKSGEDNLNKKNYKSSSIDHDFVNKESFQSETKGNKVKDHNLNQDNYRPKSVSSKLNEGVINKQVSDPVKTLNDLIDKLREKILIQPQNNNLNKIILDMENALMKISNEEQPKTTDSEICSSIKSTVSTPIYTSNQSDIKHSNIAEWDIPSLKKNLEESCLFLQSLCIKQRENCSNHIREKEQLTIQLAESRRLVAIAKSKEKDYEKAIGELRLKLQETNSVKEKQILSILDLNEQITKLKTENEALTSLKARLKECSSEKEILQSKLCIKDLEIEKLKVLLDVKQGVISASNNKQKFEEGIVEEELRLGLPQDDKASVLSLPSESTLSLSKPRIICSSQASSSPRRSPSPYDSWQHISSIPQDLTEINHLRNSMVRVFNKMKTHTEWCDSLELELEEPLVPSLSSEDDDEEEIKQKGLNLSL